MKYSFKTQLLACALALVTTLGIAACTGSNPVATAAGTLVSRYCAAPNRIRVECAADAF